MLILLSLNDAAIKVHFSSIGLTDSTLVHFIPSNTENLTIFDDKRLLLILRAKESFLLIIVSSSDPFV